MQIAPSKFDENLFQVSSFTFVQLSHLNFRLIQFKSFVHFHYKKKKKKKLSLTMQLTNEKIYFENKFSHKKSIK